MTFPQTEAEFLVCQHGNRVWFGHECGLCEEQGEHVWLKCDTCREPAVGVASMPGVPASFAYCRQCLHANAHPYGMVVANTAMIGGVGQAAEWWLEIVHATLIRLGKDRMEFERDVTEEMESQMREDGQISGD